MRIAAQFYTLRDFTKTPEGLRDALEKVSSMGYSGVQLSAVGALDQELTTVQEVRSWLDEYKLICCATHRPMDRLQNNIEEEVLFHETLGCSYAAIGGAWNYPNTAEGFSRLATDLSPIVGSLKSHNITFGYHNHSHEFIREEGKLLIERLFEVEGLDFEVDTYWVAHAGVNPSDFLRRLSGRIECLHIKDREVIDGEGPVMAPVGRGLIDWYPVIDAARSGGTEWLIVEQDTCRENPFDCLRESFDFLSKAAE